MTGEPTHGVQVRFARDYGWLTVRDPWGEWHEIAMADAPRLWVWQAMDAKKRERLMAEGRA